MRSSSLFPFHPSSSTQQRKKQPSRVSIPLITSQLQSSSPATNSRLQANELATVGCIVVAFVLAKVTIYSAAGTMGVDAFKTEFLGQHLSNIKRNLS